MIELNFGGHLGFYAPGRRSHLSFPLDQDTPLITILEMLNIPLGEINLAAVNGESVELDKATVKPGDRIDLYSPVSGG